MGDFELVSDETLLTKVETLKNMLVSRATGTECSEHEFAALRRELLKASRISAKLPRFVHSCRTLSEFWGFIKPKFPSYAERREYLREEFDPILSILESASHTPSELSASATIGKVTSSYVQDAWAKALERKGTDPEGAITAARTLLESVCKHLLDEAGAIYDDSADLPKLYNLVSRQLNLSPSQHTEQLFKQILGGCQTIVEGLGAMRNRLSDAHGRGRTGVRPAQRHAELAVNLAGTMATFLLHTAEAQRKKHPIGIERQ